MGSVHRHKYLQGDHVSLAGQDAFADRGFRRASNAAGQLCVMVFRVVEAAVAIAISAGVLCFAHRISQKSHDLVCLLGGAGYRPCPFSCLRECTADSGK